jgi:hypothetical protein
LIDDLTYLTTTWIEVLKPLELALGEKRNISVDSQPIFAFKGGFESLLLFEVQFVKTLTGFTRIEVLKRLNWSWGKKRNISVDSQPIFAFKGAFESLLLFEVQFVKTLTGFTRIEVLKRLNWPWERNEISLSIPNRFSRSKVRSKAFCCLKLNL